MPKRGLPDEVSLVLRLDQDEHALELRSRVAQQLRLPEADLPPLRLVKRSIDARGGRVRIRLWLRLLAGDDELELAAEPLRECVGSDPVVIVGDGPAGRFCAWALARSGVPSVVIDRGRPVASRRRDIASLERSGKLDPESNYCFGEGGAGTYSDGKLYTRSHKRGNVRDVIELLFLHGAPESILTDARPHIGSDRLPAVIRRMRRRLEQVGVHFRYGSRVIELLIERGSAQPRIGGVRLADGTELTARQVVLATGHSARDVYELLQQAGANLEPKPFAVGVRIEHPQALIDRIQYRRVAGHPRLPAASYRLTHEVEGRGVFTFCMCPGGFVVPASTEADGLVVNGMSRARRDSPHANSGLVVGVRVDDLRATGFAGPLGGLELQRRLECAAAQAGGGNQRAPATRVTDFLQGRASTTLPPHSYAPGLSAGDVGAVLDTASPDLARRLRAALPVFGQQMHGYVTDEAVLVAVESRTSAPVRVVRDRDSLQTPAVAGLYPCGEGAGHAGGIVSAAVDGMRVAQQILLARGALP